MQCDINDMRHLNNIQLNTRKLYQGLYMNSVLLLKTKYILCLLSKFLNNEDELHYCYTNTIKCCTSLAINISLEIDFH